MSGPWGKGCELEVARAVRRRVVVPGYSESGALLVPRVGRGLVLVWSYLVNVVPTGTVDVMGWAVQRQSSGVRIEETRSQVFGPVPTLANVHVSVGLSESQVVGSEVRIGWPAMYAHGTEEITILPVVPAGFVAVSAGTLMLYHWPDVEDVL